MKHHYVRREQRTAQHFQTRNPHCRAPNTARPRAGLRLSSRLCALIHWPIQCILANLKLILRLRDKPFDPSVRDNTMEDPFPSKLTSCQTHCLRLSVFFFFSFFLLNFHADEHQPHHSDAFRAAMAPDAEFLVDFRRALLNSSKYRAYATSSSFFAEDGDRGNSSDIAPSTLSTTTPQPVAAVDTVQEAARNLFEASQADVPYPLLLFADFPTLPPNDVLKELLDEFHEVYVPCTPFLASMCLGKSGSPPYLVLSMALLGASVSRKPENNTWTARLWSATRSLLVGVLEIDNSVSRRIDWLQAVRKLTRVLTPPSEYCIFTMEIWHSLGWAHADCHLQALLLVAYGIMQTDADVWHQTHMCYGIADAASLTWKPEQSYRVCLSQHTITQMAI